MQEEKEEIIGEVSAEALEAAFVSEEVHIEIEEEVFVTAVLVDDEEGDVDLAFQEDEGYW